MLKNPSIGEMAVNMANISELASLHIPTTQSHADCEQCRVYFVDIKTHQLYTQPPQEQRFACNQCDKSFTRKDKL
ncbi:zinc finger protein, partial [Trichonephila clavata]